MITILSIGHGLRNGNEFLALLKRYRVDVVADIRSIPYSKRNPFFRREHLSTMLRAEGMQYLFMGDQLGGRPKDASCYDAAGNLKPDVVRSKPFFRKGIEYLKQIASRQLVVILCSESDPSRCHRSGLVGESLHLQGIRMLHIDSGGQLRFHQDIMLMARKGHGEKDLFSELLAS